MPLSIRQFFRRTIQTGAALVIAASLCGAAQAQQKPDVGHFKLANGLEVVVLPVCVGVRGKMSSERTLSITSMSWVLVPLELTVAGLQDANRRTDVTNKAAPIPRPTKRNGPLLPTLAMLSKPVLLNAPGSLGGIRLDRGSYRPNMTDLIERHVIGRELRGLSLAHREHLPKGVSCAKEQPPMRDTDRQCDSHWGLVSLTGGCREWPPLGRRDGRSLPQGPICQAEK